ncbi:MAG TPA: PDZ domain-containing protein [Verrucomicrobiae bacterium]|nr:PDZ domain-containing protein [Verrucomicrobiae bacterium]
MKIQLIVVVVLAVTNLGVLAESNSVPASPGVVISGKEITGQEKDDILSNLGGVGIAIKPVADGVEVRKVFPETPACAAGMKAGDIVTQIDSTPTKGLKLQEVVDRMRGAVGSEVELVVSRPGQAAPMTLKLVRRTLSVPKAGASCE